MVENRTIDSAVKASSTNYITSGAVKTYVDNAINGVKQFKYEVVAELPTASASTMGKIYLVADTHTPSDEQPDSYDEFITIESGTTTKTYKWERIGNTDIDLSGYVPTTRKVNNKPLSGDISLGASDVGVNETAFPGLKKVGTVTSVTAGSGLSGGTITTSGTISHATPTGAKTVSAGLYKISTDGFGHVTSATAVAKSDITGLGIPGQDTNTAHTHTAGVGLVIGENKGGVSGAVDYKVALVNETKNTLSANKATGSKLYAVELDKDGKLAVNVPWTDTGVTSVSVTGTGNAVTSASISSRGLTLTKGTTFLTASDIAGKQDSLTDDQLAAVNSTITLSKVTTYEGYASKISTLEGKPGLDKTGTVTSVTLKGSTYVTVDNEAAITTSGVRKISLTDNVLTKDDVLVLDCGSSTTSW